MTRGKAGKAGTVAEAEARSVAASSTGVAQLAQLVGRQTPPKRRASRLPTAVQFPLVVVLSLCFTSLGYSFINQATKSELATIASPLSTFQAAVLVGWSICELALGWYGNFDSYDLAALRLLSHGPTLYLLASFYRIRPLTAAACLSVDVLSSFLPFLLLRPLSGAHSAAATLPNREVVLDRPIQVYTTLLAGTIYSVSLSVAYRTYLPKTLVLYFNGIPSIEPARSATTFLFVSTPAVVLCLLFGLAARTFIFAPFATTGRSPDDGRLDAFDPANATLTETLWWNLWGYTAQVKVGIVRTALAMLATAVRTYLHLAMTVKGIEPFGAVAYASVWVTAAFLTGLGLGVVGRA